MTILVFGRSGQVAQALAQLQPDAVFWGRSDCDLAQSDDLVNKVAALGPSAIINAAAYTQVDKAEDEEDLAAQINGVAVGRMAQAAATLNVPFVHISTDYVFDGSGDLPIKPDAKTAPLGAYGRSKLQGEHLIQEAGGVAAIVRTSAVFAPKGQNFVNTMLRLSETHAELRIVDDQWTGPTPADALAAACLRIADALRLTPSQAGTYHFCGQPFASWADFAQAVFDCAGRAVTITRIPSSEFPTSAKRPLNSRLDCTSLTQTFGIEQPDWSDSVTQMVKRINA